MHECHLRMYGHPAVTGMKDVARLWMAARREPEALIARDRRVSARYAWRSPATTTIPIAMPVATSRGTAPGSAPRRDVVVSGRGRRWPRG